MAEFCQDSDFKYANEKGFSLIDMAIAMLVIGLLITPILFQVKYHYQYQKIENTEENLDLANEAIEAYYHTNGFYPCPANPALSIEDTNHGVAAIEPDGNCTFVSPVNGLIAEGAIPYKELQIEEKLTHDAWSRKLFYAVTNNQAGSLAGVEAGVTAAFLPSVNGELRINEIPLVLHPVTQELVCNNPLVDPDRDSDEVHEDIHYTLFSSGEDGIGAYHKNGEKVFANMSYTLTFVNEDDADETLQTTCPIGVSEDSENCDQDGIYSTNQCRKNVVSALLQYDDLFILNARSINKPPEKDWEVSNHEDENMRTRIARVGIGSPDPQYTMDVQGNVIVRDTQADPDDDKTGIIKSTEFCDGTGINCFEAEVIGGRDPSMQCATGWSMVGIGNNKAKCLRQFSNSVTGTCSPGTYVVGVSGGEVVCAAPPIPD